MRVGRIRLASPDSVCRALAIGVLGLIVLAHSRGQSQPRELLQKREESRERHRMRISVRIVF
jgi:hypothetical protein